MEVNKETAYSFIEYRKKQESVLRNTDAQSPYLPGLLTIEVNLTELCNRKCVFCPRVDPTVYPNLNLMIPNDIVKKIASEIQRLGYNSKVSFSGFGEPLLNPEFSNIIKTFRSVSDQLKLETNTNGDKLTSERLDKLHRAGLNNLYWNLYDGPHQYDQVEKVLSKTVMPIDHIHIRPHWVGYDETNENSIVLNNRSGALKITKKTLPMSKRCNYPFYKMFIDWNGNVLSCSNDWMREFVVGNVLSTPLDQLWMHPRWHDFRTNLLNKDRASNSPCKTCDVDGELFATESLLQYKHAYATLHHAENSV